MKSYVVVNVLYLPWQGLLVFFWRPTYWNLRGHFPACAWLYAGMGISAALSLPQFSVLR